jgi:Domain of unknown function (DUF397)
MTDSPRWRKSSYSGGQGGNCVEVGHVARMIAVRDTQDRTGPALRFTPAAWRGFADRVKGGRSLASDPTPRVRPMPKGALSRLESAPQRRLPGGVSCGVRAGM